MSVFLLVLFLGGEPVGAIAMPDAKMCDEAAEIVNADPKKPPNAAAACYVLREKA